MISITPLQLVVMGVSGCGKTTLANALGQALHLRCVDGDDLHLPSSVRKMSEGIALTDEDRWPWLDRVAACLTSPPEASAELGCVVACSALRRPYRDHLRAQVPGVRFVFLDGDMALLRQRMAQRKGHFMQLQLLDSQLTTLERPAPDETDTLSLMADQALADLITHVSRTFQTQPTRTNL